MSEIYVYYRVSRAAASEALAAVLRFQQELRRKHPQLRTRLLRRRSETNDGVQTWMETYALDPARSSDGVDTELMAAIEADARLLLPLLDGPRHVEVFVALA